MKMSQMTLCMVHFPEKYAFVWLNRVTRIAGNKNIQSKK